MPEPVDFAKEESVKLAAITEAINETIAENDARSKEITELLGTLDMDPKSMSANTQDSWNKVAAILRAEGLQGVDEISLKLTMDQKKRDSMKKARDERKMKIRYNELCQRHSAFLKTQAELGRSSELLQHFVRTEQAIYEEEYPNHVYMLKKLDDYHETAEKLRKSLDEQVTPDLYPDKILEKYENYLKLLEESNSLDNDLSKYGNLPPNLTEARIKVNEKEKYLRELEHALFEKMNQ